MTAYIINHLMLAGFNLINSQVDAYRILKHKTIAHAINFGAYGAVVLFLIITQGMRWYDIMIFCVSAFCNRQLSFDIPLNLRRGLKWDYISTAKPPKAILDRIEIRIFGYNGRAPVVCYSVLFLICTVIKFFL